MKKNDPIAIELDIEQIKIILEEDPEKRNEKELASLSNYLNNITFFKQYKAEGYEDVGKQCAKYMKYEFVKKGEPVFHIDTVGDKFYLTLKGRVGIYIRLPKAQKNDQDKPDNSKPELTCVKELEEGISFGELALLNNKPRLASIVAHLDCHFMTLDKLSFSQILKQKEEEKLIQEMGFFAKLPFFEGWNYNLIKLIYLNSFRIKYSKNEKVFLEGDEPSNVYIVLDGEFVIQKKFDMEKESDEFGFKKSEGINDLIKKGTKQTKQIQLAVLVKNEMFGEEDIMNKLPMRTYSAICATVKGECILVKKRDFELRILHEEGARLYLEDRLSKKQQYWGQKINKIKGSIADYSNFLINDRQELLRQSKINLALKKIDTQSQGQEDSQNGVVSSSPVLDNNPLFSSSRSIIRKSTPLNSPLLKLPSTSSFHKINRKSSQIDVFKNGSKGNPDYISNSTFLELEKPDDENNKTYNHTNESSTHTPWRDYIAESYTKKMPETFMSLFSFQKEDYLQKESTKPKLSLNQRDSSEALTLSNMESSQSSLNVLSPFLSSTNAQDDRKGLAAPFRKLKQLTLTVPTNEFSSKLNQINLEANQDIVLNNQSPLRHKRSNFFNYSNSVFSNNAEINQQHYDQESNKPKSMVNGLSPLLNSQSQHLTQNNKDATSPSDEEKEFLISEFNHFLPINSTKDSQLLVDKANNKKILPSFQLDRSQIITSQRQSESPKINEFCKNNEDYEQNSVPETHSLIVPSSPSTFPIDVRKTVEVNNVSKENKQIATINLEDKRYQSTQSQQQQNKIDSLNSISSLSHLRSYSDFQKIQKQNIQNDGQYANTSYLNEKQTIQILNPEITSSIQKQAEFTNIKDTINKKRVFSSESSATQSSENFKDLHLSRKQRIYESLKNTKDRFFKDIFPELPLILLKSFSETTNPSLNLNQKRQKNQQKEIKSDTIFESSFSPMKGKVNEIHRYKFEQFKEDKVKHATLSLDRKIQVNGEGFSRNSSFQKQNYYQKDQPLKIIHSNKLGECNLLSSIQNLRLKKCNSSEFRDCKNVKFNSSTLFKNEDKSTYNCRANTPLPFRTLTIKNSQIAEEDSLELCLPQQRLRGQEKSFSHGSLRTVQNNYPSEFNHQYQQQNKSCQDLKPPKISNNLTQPFFYQKNYLKQSSESVKSQASSQGSISEESTHFFKRLLTSNQNKNKCQRITNQQLSSSLVISSQKEVQFHRIKTVSNAYRQHF